MLTCSCGLLLFAGSPLYLSSAAGCTAVYHHMTWAQSREGLALAADGQRRSMCLSCMCNCWCCAGGCFHVTISWGGQHGSEDLHSRVSRQVDSSLVCRQPAVLLCVWHSTVWCSDAHSLVLVKGCCWESHSEKNGNSERPTLKCAWNGYLVSRKRFRVLQSVF
jgi:hypothetical protein